MPMAGRTVPSGLVGMMMADLMANLVPRQSDRGMRDTGQRACAE
jgi:hypothetical protein